MKRILLLVLLGLLPLGVQAAPRTIHVLVALCDNLHQGIVPVPAKIGNGQDPANNLYWGAMYGVKTFMSKQKDWKRLDVQANPAPHILERLVFKHATEDVFIIADAYDGAFIKDATQTFLDYAAGNRKLSLSVGEKTIDAGGGAQLIVYIGHNGLMDFSLASWPTQADKNKRETAVFACMSKQYFSDPVKAGGAQPLLWTTNFMAPEAYTLHALVGAWVRKDTPETMREQVAQAYHRYQKSGITGARRLFVTK